MMSESQVIDANVKRKPQWAPERKESLRILWLQGLTAADIGARLEPPCEASVVHVMAFRMGLPKRIKTSAGQLEAPVLRADVKMKHPPSPKMAGERSCIRCGKRFWSPGAHVRRCPNCRRAEFEE